MLKPASSLAESAMSGVQPNAQPNPQKAAAQIIAQSVFRVLHGYYGSLFLTKFATGSVNAQREDMGVLSARRVWANALEKFEKSVVMDALGACEKAHPEYPPSLPQFLALCRAAAPRAIYKPDVPALPMGQTLRSRYAAQARAINAKHDQRAINPKVGFVDLPANLDGLKQAVAMAVGLAGGDETVTLLRLDLQFAPRAARIKGVA